MFLFQRLCRLPSIKLIELKEVKTRSVTTNLMPKFETSQTPEYLTI